MALAEIGVRPGGHAIFCRERAESKGLWEIPSLRDILEIEKAGVACFDPRKVSAVWGDFITSRVCLWVSGTAVDSKKGEGLSGKIESYS